MSKFGGYEDQPFLAELYDQLPAYAARKDIAFYVDYARSVNGPVLELACGTGRVLIPVAESGCQIVGLDLSEFMLAKCRSRLKKAAFEVRNRVRIIRGDMTNYGLGETFALVTTPFRPFQHLISVQDQLACLRCANRHLRPGGTLILDLFHPNLEYLCSPSCFNEQEDCTGVTRSDGSVLRQAHRIKAQYRSRQMMDVEMIFYVTHPDGREEQLVHAFPFRYFFRYEIEHMLARRGFSVVDVFGDFDKSPFADDSREMIFVATKVRELEP
ncbi:MAG: methyltransferase [Candidatus Hydrogenedentota bacterium]